jgi:hypothetical protein
VRDLQLVSTEAEFDDYAACWRASYLFRDETGAVVISGSWPAGTGAAQRDREARAIANREYDGGGLEGVLGYTRTEKRLS